jgi:hypothetical protein
MSTRSSLVNRPSYIDRCLGRDIVGPLPRCLGAAGGYCFLLFGIIIIGFILLGVGGNGLLSIDPSDDDFDALSHRYLALIIAGTVLIAIGKIYGLVVVPIARGCRASYSAV